MQGMRAHANILRASGGRDSWVYAGYGEFHAVNPSTFTLVWPTRGIEVGETTSYHFCRTVHPQPWEREAYFCCEFCDMYEKTTTSHGQGNFR